MVQKTMKKGQKSNGKTIPSDVKFVFTFKDENVAIPIDHLNKTLRKGGIKTILHGGKRETTAVTKQSLFEFIMKRENPDMVNILKTVENEWKNAAEILADIWEQSEWVSEYEEMNPRPNKENYGDDEENYQNAVLAWETTFGKELNKVRQTAIESLVAELPDDDFAWF